MSSSTQTPSPEQVREVCKALATCLGEEFEYAIVGGAACQLLGYPDATEDVEFVVPQGADVEARKRLAADKDHFTVDPPTQYIYYRLVSPEIRVRIISPPEIFMETFDATMATHTLSVDDCSVKILYPTFILNAKCRHTPERESDDMTQTDLESIAFLLKWLAYNIVRPSTPDTSQGTC